MLVKYNHGDCDGHTKDLVVRYAMVKVKGSGENAYEGFLNLVHSVMLRHGSYLEDKCICTDALALIASDVDLFNSVVSARADLVAEWFLAFGSFHGECLKVVHDNVSDYIVLSNWVGYFSGPHDERIFSYFEADNVMEYDPVVAAGVLEMRRDIASRTYTKNDAEELNHACYWFLMSHLKDWGEYELRELRANILLANDLDDFSNYVTYHQLNNKFENINFYEGLPREFEMGVLI